jgi:hypothetical protein
LEVKQKKAGKISMQEHEMILEEAERCNRLEYNDDDDSDEQEAGRGQWWQWGWQQEQFRTLDIN